MTSKTIPLIDIKDYINNNFKDLNALFNNSPYWNIDDYQIFLGHYIKRRIFDVNKTTLYIDSYTPIQKECIEKWCVHNNISSDSVRNIKNEIRKKINKYDFEHNIYTLITRKSAELTISALPNIIQLSDSFKTSIKEVNHKPKYSYISRENGFYNVDFNTVFIMSVSHKNTELFNILKTHRPKQDIIKALTTVFELYDNPETKLNALYFLLTEHNVENDVIVGVLFAYQLLSPKINVTQLIESLKTSSIPTIAMDEMPIFE